MAEEKEKKQEKEREDEHKERTSVRGGRADEWWGWRVPRVVEFD